MTDGEYVKMQLDLLDKDEYISMKLTDYPGTTTRFFGINDVESIDAVIKFLTEVKTNHMEKSEDV